jgi:hypothetical protein
MSQKLLLECIQALKLDPDEELSKEKINQAFRPFALSLHPDKCNGDEAKKKQFQLLVEQRDRLLKDVRDGLRYSTDIALFYPSGEFKCFERYGQAHGGSAPAGGSAACRREIRTAEQTRKFWREAEANMQAATAGPIGGAAADAAAGGVAAAASRDYDFEQEWVTFRTFVKMHATADGAAAGGTASAAAGAAGKKTASASERQEARDCQLKQLEQENAELQKQKQAKQRELNQLKQELNQVQQELDQIKQHNAELREQEAREQEARKQEAHARKEALHQQAREQLEQHNANLMQINAQLRQQQQQKQDALNALKNKGTGKEQADPAEHEPAAQQPIRRKLKARKGTEEEKQAYDMQVQCEQLPGNSSDNPFVFSSSSADEEAPAAQKSQEAPAAQESQEAGMDLRGADRDDAETDDNDGSFGWSRAGRRRKFTDRYRPANRPPKRE